MTSVSQVRVLPERIEAEHADYSLSWNLGEALVNKWVWLVIEVEEYPDILEGILYD